MTKIKRALWATASMMAMLAPDAGWSQVGDWPELYDPLNVVNLRLRMAPEDWQTIVNDATFDIEVPALFATDGEPPILVSVRRKSATKLGTDKISLKIDINEYHDEDEFGNDICITDGGFDDPECVSEWHGVKKLSLENGDDVNVLAEGFAWYLHRLASESILDYQTGLANWVVVRVNGEPKGLYVSVEQPDKQYLKNRDLWVSSDDTWLYKYSDVGSEEIKEAPEDENGDPIHSPAFEELCFEPFQSRDPCAMPIDFENQVEALVNVEGLLTFGAVSAFHNSPDDLFSKNKNYYVIDFSSAELGLRDYVQWDLDSAFQSYDSDGDIYDQRGGNSDLYEAILVEPLDAPYRDQYSGVMGTLLDGPFDEQNLLEAIDDIEAAIGPLLDRDPNSQIEGPSAGEFDKLRQFVSERIVNIRDQLP